MSVPLCVAQAAATLAGGKVLTTEVSTADVLKVTAVFERWLLREASRRTRNH